MSDDSAGGSWTATVVAIAVSLFLTALVISTVTAHQVYTAETEVRDGAHWTYMPGIESIKCPADSHGFVERFKAATYMPSDCMKGAWIGLSVTIDNNGTVENATGRVP